MIFQKGDLFVCRKSVTLYCFEVETTVCNHKLKMTQVQADHYLFLIIILFAYFVLLLKCHLNHDIKS